jgi:DNA-binding CsgD family transcriptional regulator
MGARRAPAKPGLTSDDVLAARRGVARALVARLTGRELQVLGLLIDGFTNKEIAISLKISHRTVEIHRAHMLSKLGVNNSLSAVSIGAQAGLGECAYLKFDDPLIKELLFSLLSSDEG